MWIKVLIQLIWLIIEDYDGFTKYFNQFYIILL